MSKLKWVLSVLLAIAVIFSCRKDLEKISWNMEMVVPIAHTSLNLKNLLQDTTLTEDSNNRLQVVYKQELDRFSPLDTLVELSVDSFSTEVTLSSIEVDDVTIEENNNIGDIITSAGINGQSYGGITIQDGATIPAFVFLVIPRFSTSPNQIDVTDFFESAVLSQGFIDIEIENNTDLDITNMYISVVDNITSDTVFTKHITGTYDQNNNFSGEAVFSKSTYQDFGIDLAEILQGQEIHGEMTFRIEEIQLAPQPDQEEVTLNYSDNFAFSITLRDLKVERAKAVFPAQNVLERVEEVPLEAEDGVELTYGIVKKGEVSINVSSTIAVPLLFDYVMPGAVKDGVPFTIPTQRVPAGTIDNPAIYSRSFSIDGYAIDFTGLPERLVGNPKYDGFSSNLTNTIIQELNGRIEDVTEQVSLSLNDTLTLEIKVENLEVDYVEGYLGQRTITIGPQALDFAYNREVPYQSLNFEKIDVGIFFENNIGVPADMVIKRLEFINQENSNSASVDNLPLTTRIESATKNNNQTGSGNSDFTISNSKEIYDLQPNYINYEFDINVNPEGNTPPYSNFASVDNELILYSAIKFPLSVVADDFILTDTIPLSLGEEDRQENIENGVVNLVAENGFPFLMDVKLYFSDSTSGEVLDSLIAVGQIPAARVNEQGKVTEIRKSVIPFPFDKERLNTLISPKTNRIIMEVVINSEDKEKYLSIYSDYTLDVLLSGDFKFRVNSKL